MWWVEGEIGVDAVKMERECLREGSEKEGVPVGLIGCVGGGGCWPPADNGGKSVSEDSKGTAGICEVESCASRED